MLSLLPLVTTGLVFSLLSTSTTLKERDHKGAIHAVELVGSIKNVGFCIEGKKDWEYANFGTPKRTVDWNAT
jgi:hypothetical protein